MFIFQGQAGTIAKVTVVRQPAKQDTSSANKQALQANTGFMKAPALKDMTNEQLMFGMQIQMKRFVEQKGRVSSEDYVGLMRSIRTAEDRGLVTKNDANRYRTCINGNKHEEIGRDLLQMQIMPAETAFNSAKNAGASGDFDRAIKLYDRAIGRIVALQLGKPALVDAYESRAIAKKEAGRLQEAIGDYNQALAYADSAGKTRIETQIDECRAKLKGSSQQSTTQVQAAATVANTTATQTAAESASSTAETSRTLPQQQLKLYPVSVNKVWADTKGAYERNNQGVEGVQELKLAAANSQFVKIIDYSLANGWITQAQKDKLMKGELPENFGKELALLKAMLRISTQRGGVRHVSESFDAYRGKSVDEVLIALPQIAKDMQAYTTGGKKIEGKKISKDSATWWGREFDAILAKEKVDKAALTAGSAIEEAKQEGGATPSSKNLGLYQPAETRMETDGTFTRTFKRTGILGDDGQRFVRNKLTGEMEPYKNTFAKEIETIAQRIPIPKFETSATLETPQEAKDASANVAALAKCISGETSVKETFVALGLLNKDGELAGDARALEYVNSMKLNERKLARAIKKGKVAHGVAQIIDAEMVKNLEALGITKEGLVAKNMNGEADQNERAILNWFNKQEFIDEIKRRNNMNPEKAEKQAKEASKSIDGFFANAVATVAEEAEKKMAKPVSRVETPASQAKQEKPAAAGEIKDENITIVEGKTEKVDELVGEVPFNTNVAWINALSKDTETVDYYNKIPAERRDEVLERIRNANSVYTELKKTPGKVLLQDACKILNITVKE